MSFNTLLINYEGMLFIQSFFIQIINLQVQSKSPESQSSLRLSIPNTKKWFITKLKFIQINFILIHKSWMQIKINFDQLFNTGNQTQLNTTIQNQSLQFSQQLTNSLNNSVQYKFSFKNNFFDSQQIGDYPDQQLKQQYSQIESSSKSIKPADKQIKNRNIKSHNPGERLFYESKEQQLRKMKQIQKINQQKQMQLNKIVTFVPTINQNSRKMAQRQKMQPKINSARPKAPLKSTEELRMEEIQKQCTFHPKLIAKNRKQGKSKEQLFYYLHNTSKIKEMKVSKMAEQAYKQYSSTSNKGNLQDFNNFLKRNEQYNSLVKKKQQILKSNSQKYDLKTGQKLFSPKTTESKVYRFNSTTNKQLKNNQKETAKNDPEPLREEQILGKPKSRIFGKKKVCQEEENYINQKYFQAKKQNENIHEQQRRYRQLKQKGSKKGSPQMIVEQQQFSANQHQRNINMQNIQIFDPDKQSDEIQGQDLNVWGSNQIKPFQLSNVNQYLNASEEDEQEHKNNYVMDILNNLMIKQDDQ